MKKPTVLEQVTTPNGNTMALVERDGDYVIRVDGRELMSTRHAFSEQQLGVVACQPLAKKAGARVLVGGLGLGMTLRAALDQLAGDAEVVVAELIPEVVTWNRNVAYPLSARALSDPRTCVVICDVARVVKESEARFDAIMLDADNQTTTMNTAGNSWLYEPAGLRAVHRALTQRGTVVYWSPGEDPVLAKRLAAVGFTVEVQRVRKHPSAGGRHVLLVAHRNELGSDLRRPTQR